MFNIERHWYQSGSWLSWILIPFSYLFALIVVIRQALFRLKIKKSYRLTAPVIVVGNITVGGTGKTPLVLSLVNLLKQQGLKPGILCRGVGAKQKIRQPRLVDAASQPEEVGDEALLLYRNSAVPVGVGIDRVAVGRMLLQQCDCNILISDDGLQHYRLGRDLEVIVVDGERGEGNGRFLPAGPLRESRRRLKQADFVITQGVADSGYYFQLRPIAWIPLVEPKQPLELYCFQGKRVHAIAAIGYPERFFKQLRLLAIELIPHAFPDHYLLKASNLEFGDQLPVVMTEKDAVKCERFAKQQYWYLAVQAELSQDFSRAFLQKLTFLIKSDALLL